ncbi:MAG: alpha-hydroxy acid oxidase [Pseudomonadota bacterium]
MWDPSLLDRYPSVASLARRAKWRIPHFAFEYLDSGTGSDISMDESVRALQRITIVPKMLAGAYEPDTTTEIFGKTYALPFGVAPVGATGMMWPEGEKILARAAAKHGFVYALSTVACETPETIGPLAGGNGWFQLYTPGDGEMRRDVLRRAEAAGFSTLLLTIDVPVPSMRERQRSSGLTMPPNHSLRTYAQILGRPAWTAATLGYRLPSFPTVERYLSKDAKAGMAGRVSQAIGGRPDWETVAAIRDEWKGPFVLKGVMAEEDAERALAIGLDGIGVSSHGGRQFDACPAPIDHLPAIKRVVGDRAKIVFDSGLRGGLDIMRALALGADFCLLGRAFIYAIAALGPKGGEHMAHLLKEDLTNNMVQTSVRNLAELRQMEIRHEAS